MHNSLSITNENCCGGGGFSYPEFLLPPATGVLLHLRRFKKNLFGKLFLKVQHLSSPVSATPCWLICGPSNTPCTFPPLNLVLIFHLSPPLHLPKSYLVFKTQDKCFSIKLLLSPLTEGTVPSRNSF